MRLRQLLGLSDNNQQSSANHRGNMTYDVDATSKELLSIANKLESLKSDLELPEIKAPLEKLEDAATTIGRSWSGSWLGYHSRVYSADFQMPPRGTTFSQEWGMLRVRGDWVTYRYEEVYELIYEIAGRPDLKLANELGDKAKHIFDESQSEIISLLTTVLEENDDTFLASLKNEVKNAQIYSWIEILQAQAPKNQIISRDMEAIGQGIQGPPHLARLAEITAIRQSVSACRELSKIALRAGSHLARKGQVMKDRQQIGTTVFIGHGRSQIWRDLKDFIQDRLGLPWDEFNRVPVAGITNIARLSQMLESAAIAFVVLTAEDELADGKMQARMNVVHEAGLFQGKLGFTKAIVLLEDGCEEFSNIQGLGQIRFPKGNIKAAFEEIRRVLEREDVISI